MVTAQMRQSDLLGREVLVARFFETFCAKTNAYWAFEAGLETND